MKKTFLVLLGIALLFSCGKNKTKDPEPQDNYTSVEITANELKYSQNQDLSSFVFADYWYGLQSVYNRAGIHENTSSVIGSLFPLTAKLDLSEAKFNDEKMTEFSEGTYAQFSFSKKTSNLVNYKLKDHAGAYKYNVNVTLVLPDTFSIKSAPTVISKDVDVDIELSKNITNSDHTELQLYQRDDNDKNVLISSHTIDGTTRTIHLERQFFKKLRTGRVVTINIVANKYGSKLVDSKKHVFAYSNTCELGTFQVEE